MPLVSRARAQALVELAVVMPMLVGLVAVLFQFGTLFVIYLSLVHASRDVGRWIAVHPDTTDAQFQAYVSAHVPSTVSRAHLTATITPACPSLSNGRCAARPAGAPLRVSMRYDATGSIFLPTGVWLGVSFVRLALVLPAYDYYVMAEQR